MLNTIEIEMHLIKKTGHRSDIRYQAHFEQSLIEAIKQEEIQNIVVIQY